MSWTEFVSKKVLEQVKEEQGAYIQHVKYCIMLGNNPHSASSRR